MKLTEKLLGYLHRVFDKGPDAFVALRVHYAGDLAWSVADGVLTLTVVGGPGTSASYDLSQHTLDSLVNAIAARAGFQVTFADRDRLKLSALVLLDGAGDQSQPNGDAILGYTSILWAIMEAYSVQLQVLRDQVGNMLLQMSTKTASDIWLDELGSYYGVPRDNSESDALYGQRIIAQTLRPISNNVAIERAIEALTGQPCTVTDVTIYRGVFPVYDGTIDHDGTHDYDTVGLPNYGLFDVTAAYDLVLGGDIAEFQAGIEAVVAKVRAAGTFLRALALNSAADPITDAFAGATDSASPWVIAIAHSDVLDAPAETSTGYTGVMTDMVEALSAPSEAQEGLVYAQLRASDGSPITDDTGQPLLASTGPLFV